MFTSNARKCTMQFNEKHRQNFVSLELLFGDVNCVRSDRVASCTLLTQVPMKTALVRS